MGALKEGKGWEVTQLCKTHIYPFKISPISLSKHCEWSDISCPTSSPSSPALPERHKIFYDSSHIHGKLNHLSKSHHSLVAKSLNIVYALAAQYKTRTGEATLFLNFPTKHVVRNSILSKIRPGENLNFGSFTPFSLLPPPSNVCAVEEIISFESLSL